MKALAALAIAVLSVPPSSEPKPIPEGYSVLVDDTGLIVVAAPDEWTEIDTAPAANEDGTPRPNIAAAPDLLTFQQTFDVPGMLYVAFPFALDPLVLIEEYGIRSGCETIEVKTYEDPVFTGVVQIGTNCGPQAMTWQMVAANPADESFTAVVQVQSTVADEIRTVLLTFNIVPGATVPGSTVPASTVAGSTIPSTTVPPTTAG